MKLSRVFKSMFAVTALAVSSLSFASDIDMNADVNDVALRGYDTVSYFTKGAPTKGSSEFSATYKNAIYQFSSEKNRDLFKNSPDKYAPQYGGFCAMGVALNMKLDGDPNVWRLVDNKLYLNLNAAVKKKWMTDVPGHLNTAEKSWPEIKLKTAAELSDA